MNLLTNPSEPYHINLLAMPLKFSSDRSKYMANLAKGKLELGAGNPRALCIKVWLSDREMCTK